MALPDVCFDSQGGTACNCTGPPPVLPLRPDFCLNTTTTPGLIIGCTCGVLFFIVICVVIWWVWKKYKCCCFVAGGVRRNSESQECLPGSEEKEVELLTLKKGTVVLIPLHVGNPLPLPAWPGPGGPPSLPPIQNKNADLTPVEMSKAQETSPSEKSESRPSSSKSEKRKKSGGRSNRVSPEPSPGPVTGESDA